jgi:hypothetical protein
VPGTLAPTLRALESRNGPEPLPLFAFSGDGRDDELAAKAVPASVLLLLPADHSSSCNVAAP